MATASVVNRREFLKTGAAGGAALVVWVIQISRTSREGFPRERAAMHSHPAIKACIAKNGRGFRRVPCLGARAVLAPALACQSISMVFGREEQ